MTLLLAFLACSSAPPAPVAAPPPARSSLGPLEPRLSLVDCGGNGDFTTIQAAIDAAPISGWIEVAPCSYHEAIDFKGKSLWIQSTAGPAATAIDAGGEDGVVVTRGESDNTALVGFTLKNADTAVLVERAALRLQEVVITDSGDDYVIDAEGADLELEAVTIDETNDVNDAVIRQHRGGISGSGLVLVCGDADVGLSLEHGGIHLDWSTLDCETADYAVDVLHTTGRIQRTALLGDVRIENEELHPEDRVTFQADLVKGDTDVHWGTAWFENTTFAGGRVTFLDTSESATIVNSIFSRGDCAISSNVAVVVSHTDFWDIDASCEGFELVGNNGNIDDDPLFVDAPNGDYTLGAGSPAIDAGDPDPEYDDVDGTPSDLGYTGGKHSILGGW